MPWILPTQQTPTGTSYANAVGNIVGLRYAHQTAPWDAPLSWGVQAFIEYNGLVLNDRYQADRIRVTKITGLDDADSTDSREAVPGDHDEFVYDAFYRGRTFVMTGEISAGSLGVGKRLERDLKAAFGPLVEAPMKFRWFDIYDSFDDQGTTDNYTAVIGGAAANSVTVSGGVVRWGTTQSVVLIRSADRRMFGDVQTTIRMIVGSTASTSVMALIPKYIDSSNFIEVAYNEGSGSPTLNIVSLVAGLSHTLSTTALSGIQQGQSIWLRSRVEGDLVTAEVWTTPPSTTALPAFSTSAWLSGSDADLFGDQVLTQSGFGGSAGNTNWAFDDFKIESLCPGDVTFPVRKLPNGLSFADSQDSPTRYKRNFQITVRSSQAFACATQTRSQTLVPTASNTPQLGFSFPLTFPLSFKNFLPGTIQQINNLLFVNNRGTAFSRPKLVVYGATNPFTIINLTNGQQISWTGTLLDGDFLVFDCAARKVVNSAGTSMMKYFSSTSSSWMRLEPGWNDLYFGGTGYSGNTKFFLWSQAAYL